jgi:hypothetical protein
MSNGTPNNAQNGMNLDVSELNPEANKTAKFIKNLTTSVNKNGDGGTPQIAGNNQTILTPLVSNVLICDVELPEGENYCIGAYNNTNSKETYCHVWNSNNNHTFYKIDENEKCEIVYQGPCLGYSLSPENHIPQNRNELFYKCQTNLFTGISDYIRDYVFTDNLNWQRFISVNDSIATKSFTQDSAGPTQKFLFSDPSDANSVRFDPCEYIQLAPRMPITCIGIKEIANTEPSKNNFLLGKTWQFRVKFIDVWNRESEHGVISDMYIPSTSGCQANSSGLPRCLNLKIDAGSPIVSKIQIEFRNCVSTNTDIQATTDWFIHDTVSKYANCGANDGKDWFDRIITLNGTYNATENTFDYVFCADKQCTPISVDETNRTANPLPITSGSLLRIGNGIALANNKVNYPAVDCNTVNLLNVEYEPPVAECKPEYCDIEFWAVIHNAFMNVNEPIYNEGGSDDGNHGYKDGRWKWGGIGPFNGVTIPTITDTDTDYGQTFTGQTNGQRNFYAYLEGTDFKVQGYQQFVNGGIKSDWGAELVSDNAKFRQIGNRIRNGGYYLQHFVFKNVPKGKYLVRIAGHNNSMDATYQDSSTYVLGTILESNYVSDTIDWGDVDSYYKELEINTCSFSGTKFSTSTMFLICDLTCPDPTFVVNGVRSNGYYGYLKDSENHPVELAPVVIKKVTSLGSTINQSIFTTAALTVSPVVNKTDHNGFWFCAYGNDGIIVLDDTIFFNYKVEDAGCASKLIEFTGEYHSTNSNTAEIPLTVSEDAILGVPNYGKCKSVLIQGLIVDCDNNPVSNAVFCFTRSKSAKTNGSGYFSIIIHNDIDSVLANTTPLGREIDAATLKDRIFLSQNGSCVFIACDSCVMCVTTLFNVDINLELMCFDCDGPNKKILSVSPTQIRFPFSDQRGLKHGSSVKFGLKLYDAAGRHTFVGTDDSLNLTIPKAQEQLSQLFGKIKYTLTQNTFESWVKYVGIYWTDQQAQYSFLDFVISSRDIDISSGKITLGFQSIINYNTANNFKTNTTWEFQKGDRVEFIADEFGNFYNSNTLGLLNFQIEGNTTNNSGVIDYDPRLANLQIGTLVQLQRPKECTSELFWWEVCAPIKLDINNQIPTTQLTGYLNIWNAYLVSRKIKYAVGGVETLFSFPFNFEHFTPSDFWGGNCGNRGRVNTTNPYEQQYCKPMNVMFSDGYATNINGLSRFDTANQHEFDDNGFGYITAMVSKLNYVLIICAKSAFVVAYDDQTLKMDNQGRLIYTGEKFSKPNPQNMELGCEMVDISTIAQKDGTVMFLDRNNGALVTHDFQNTEDVSRWKFYGYLVTKLDTVNKYNNNTQNQFVKYYTGGFNNENGDYVLTQFDIPKFHGVQDPKPTYINSEAEINEQVSETFSYNPDLKSMRSFLSFTPEAYSILNDKLISFKQGKAYNHGIRNINSFNEFYGAKNVSVFDFVCNADRPDLVKYYQWLEVYCKEQKFFAKKITTESSQLSQIPEELFELVDNFYTSSILCDVNTYADPQVPELATPVGRLLNGDTLCGKWIRIKLISNNAGMDNYYELQASVVFSTDIQKSGIEGNPKQ